MDLNITPTTSYTTLRARVAPDARFSGWHLSYRRGNQTSEHHSPRPSVSSLDASSTSSTRSTSSALKTSSVRRDRGLLRFVLSFQWPSGRAGRSCALTITRGRAVVARAPNHRERRELRFRYYFRAFRLQRITARAKRDIEIRKTKRIVPGRHSTQTQRQGEGLRHHPQVTHNFGALSTYLPSAKDGHPSSGGEPNSSNFQAQAH